MKFHGLLLSACAFLFALARDCSAANAAVADNAPNDTAALAEKLNNPIASMISVPFQGNLDFNVGPEDGWRYQLNTQPVIPISLNDSWNVLSRTIMPLIFQEHVLPGEGDQFGLGDITQSFFFSPKKSGGLIWGAGPAFLIPTGTDDLLGTGKFGLGPTFVALEQSHGWTYGMLANHIWSVAGEGGRADVSSTFLQPFVSYTTPTAWTYGVNTESSYDWDLEQWSVPLNAFISKMVKIDQRPVSFTLGARYWADSPHNGPHDLGMRFVVTYLFPE